jgi:NADP-dependent 3-hydroxy acid dehydrogenase YdfG
MNIFLTGGSSGIGKACAEILAGQGHKITAPNRHELDLSVPYNIENLQLSDFDAVVNCAGSNVGTYLGFYDNPVNNQILQLNVNFISPLMLVKNYSKVRPNGHFVYISSISIDTPYLYNIVNSTSKAALKYSMDVIRKELPKFIISEICPGKTKTNMLAQNYNGTKNINDIEQEYLSTPYLSAEQVANCVVLALEQKIDLIKVVPRE